MFKRSNFTTRFDKKSPKLIAPLVLAALLFVVATPMTAQAHCDSADGPVVGAAKQAIEKNNVNFALPYIGPQYEEELKAAFNNTIAARQAGGKAQEVADNYFHETTLRFHRATENAPYNGIQPAGKDYGPALEAADVAIESGSTEGVKKVLNDAINKQVDVVFAKVTATKVGPEASVEARRESVNATFGFEKYALGIYDTAMAGGGHSEGEKAAGADAHGAATKAGGDAHGAATTAGTEAAAAEGQHGAEKSATDILTLALAAVGLLGIGVVIGRKAGIKHASGNCKH